MLKKIMTMAVATALPFFLFAQEKIETDRPTESQNASVVPKGKFQAEIGFRREQQDEKTYDYLDPNAIFRYGVINGLELRLRTPFETDKMVATKESTFGLQPVEVGLKARIFQTKDTSFILSIFGKLGLPHLAAKAYELDKTFYTARILVQNKLGENIKLTANAGRDWDSKKQQQVWMYSISPQIELSDKWQLFLEEYADLKSKESVEHYIDAGVAYGITKNLQIDVTAGKGLSSEAMDYFAGLGISFRL